MVIAQVATLAVLGAVVGSVLAVLAWRIPRESALQPSERGDLSTLPKFWWDVPLVRRLTGGQPPEVSRTAVPAPILELGTAALFVVMLAVFGLTWTLPAYLLLVAGAVLLTVIDLQHRRLPNRVIVPFTLLTVVAVAISAASLGNWQGYLRAFAGGLALFAIYLVLALISPAGLGMGDVKLAGPVGAYLAYLGWRSLIIGAAGAFFVIAAVGLILLATGRAGRRTQVPFGPAMLASAIVTAALVGPSHLA